MNTDQALDAISSTAFRLLLKEPFYAHVLAGLPREASDRVETAAVGWDGKQVRLIVNPEFFDTLRNDGEQVAVLKHEVLHVVFRHLFRHIDRDPKIENIAADLVVNQLIAPWPLPATAVTLNSFPDLQLAPDRSLDYYYDLLAGLRGATAGAKRQRSSQGGAARPHTAASAPLSTAALERLLAAGGRGDHSLWTAEESPAATAARYAVEESVLRARDRVGEVGWDTLPAAVHEAIAAIVANRHPQVDWRRTVRLFATTTGRTRIRHTMRKTSKRFGTRPGIKVKRSSRLVVAIDTSGSIDDELLASFFIEIHGLWRNGPSITIVECDAAIQSVYPYRGTPPQAVKGRGGTAFDPVFTWMRDQRPFDGCIYLTDGVAGDPVVKPCCQLLWAQSEPRARALPFGRTVLLCRS